ncbi:hypothetical protein FJ546_19075 [Mesorhizobium sp. B2-4-19]|uniref:hypothetical protein n=1 Tax=Mesorhizobium sp. B2-4-19 TaxID=2589930 RepID=UPI00112E6F75|nr:hypothetical protein [Mesorhizobium sp. B2-4-19]TPK60478.1 hypothetical protein FJ546_19075 [Mesorhizobium sp. B2-4-19]
MAVLQILFGDDTRETVGSLKSQSPLIYAPPLRSDKTLSAISRRFLGLSFLGQDNTAMLDA